MSSSQNGEISFSFECLQKLMASFQGLDDSEMDIQEQEAIGQLVDHLGEIAIPILFRNLFGSASAGDWSSALLVRLANEEGLKTRILRQLQEYQNAPALSDTCQLRVSDLRATLKGWQSELSAFSLPVDNPEYYLHNLATSMQSAYDVAFASDTLIREYPPQELLDYLELFAESEPGAAKSLIHELILRDDLTLSFRQTLRSLAAGMCDILNEVPISRSSRPRLRFAVHPSGATALVCYISRPKTTPTQFRAIRFDIETRNGLAEAQYYDGMQAEEIEQQIILPLMESGFELSPIAPAEARKRVVLAMRARTSRGLSMPTPYYLGRDILGLQEEHLVQRAKEHCDVAALLARGTELMSRGKASEACDLLLRYAKQRPDDPEAMSVLGSCLVLLGELQQARHYVALACQLSPAVSRYHWNRASLAHQEGQLGECYRAFRAYLDCKDASDAKQRKLADTFVQQYSRQSTLREVPPSIANRPKLNR